MTADIERRLDHHERKLEQVDGLRSDLAVLNERQNQQLAETKRTNESVNKLADAMERSNDRFNKTLFEGTEKDDPHDVRIARLETFSGRIKSWGSAALALLSAMVVALFGWVLSKGHR